MTSQQARVELKQIHTYYNRIAERKKRLAELRSSMTTIRISKYGNAPAVGATANDRYRLENAIDRATKLEEQVSVDIVAMAEAQQQLVEKIERLPEPYATVLTKRYIHLERFEKIAVDLHYSYRTVKRYCVTGLQKYSEL